MWGWLFTSNFFVRLVAQKSPFFAMMGGFHPHPSRKNGDESSKEATEIAATRVVDRVRAAVSHAAGLEASPTMCRRSTFEAAMGLAASGAGSGGDDLGRRRLRVRAVRGGTRVLRDVPRSPKTSRRDAGGVSKGVGSPADAAALGAGSGRPRRNSAALCRAPHDRRLRADGLRRVANRVPAFGRTGSPHGQRKQRGVSAHRLGDGLRPSRIGAAVVLADRQGNRRRTAALATDAVFAAGGGLGRGRCGLYGL